MVAVYAAYGRAMMAAHSLEARLAALLLTRLAAQFSKEAFRRERDELDRLTLGSLIRRFIREFEPSERVTNSLRNALCVRNDLAHRISNRILMAAQEARWEEGTTAELMEVADCFAGVRSELDPLVAKFFSALGIREQELLERELAKYPGIRYEQESD